MELKNTPGRIFAEDANGDLLCEITFPSKGRVAEIDHTFVSDALRGQGVAGQLMALAVQQIKDNGMKAAATCSYAVKWFENHPEEKELLEIE